MEQLRLALPCLSIAQDFFWGLLQVGKSPLRGIIFFLHGFLGVIFFVFFGCLINIDSWNMIIILLLFKTMGDFSEIF